VLELWRSLQDWIIEDVCQVVFERAMAAAVAAGTLTLAGYDVTPERYEAVKWFPRGWEFVDPQKESAANKDLVRSGFKTQAQIVAEQGGDLEDLLTARASEVQRAQELGIQFDTNPADDMQGGATDAEPETEDEPEDPSEPDNDTEDLA
jgi:capsid protein